MDRNRDSALAHPLFWLVLTLLGAGEFQAAYPITAFVANALPIDLPFRGGATGRRRHSRPQRSVPYSIAAESTSVLRDDPG